MYDRATQAPDEITTVDKRPVLGMEWNQGLDIQQWGDHTYYCGIHKD
jgi:hypothetical protein